MTVVRSPRIRLLANNNVIRGAIKMEVVSNNHYSASRMSGDISLSADATYGLAWWASQADIMLDCQMAISQTNAATPAWQSICTGRVDHLQFDDIGTMCVRFDGRDRTADLIDAKTQETFANQTSSQIATTLAGRHGLTADVTATTTTVGQYYELEHDRITHDNFSHQTTEWDLLTNLAQEEDFDVWVTGTTLHFKPKDDSTVKTYSVNYSPACAGNAVPTLDVETVSMERSLTLANDIEVVVKTTNLRNGVAYIKTAKGVHTKSVGATNSTTQKYVFLKPGLTPDQALKYAQQKLSELSRHERVLNIMMPGELTWTARDKVQLIGTNSAFDQVYYIDEITREMDFEGGFTQHVRVKNTSPISQTTVS